MPKFLLIRLSSIGDVVITTPVVRCIAEQVKDAEVHFLTRKAFVPLLEANPYIRKIHVYDDNLPEVLKELKDEGFDYVIDLHKNLRTRRLRMHLRSRWISYHKLNILKWIRVRTRWKVLPGKHLVDRYFEALQPIGVKNDGKGMDFFLPAVTVPTGIPEGQFVAITLGAKFATKAIPVHKAAEFCKELPYPVVVLGGKAEMEKSAELAALLPGKVTDLSGQLDLPGSAYVISRASCLITGDTGLMHIAAALKKNVVSVWGSTTPDFGMYPYLPEDMADRSVIIEENVGCRPCSKLGFDTCPRGHFRCMNDIPGSRVQAAVFRLLNP